MIAARSARFTAKLARASRTKRVTDIGKIEPQSVRLRSGGLDAVGGKSPAAARRLTVETETQPERLTISDD